MKIRKAEEKDIPFLIKQSKELASHHYCLPTEFTTITHELHPKAEKELEKLFKNELKNKDTALFVVEDEEKIAGHIFAKKELFLPMFKEDSYGNLMQFFVEQEYRGKGLGKKLIKEAEKFYKKKRIKLFMVGVNCFNKESYAKYKKMGYTNFVHQLIKKI